MSSIKEGNTFALTYQNFAIREKKNKVKVTKEKAIRWLSIISFFVFWQGLSLVNGHMKLFNPVFLPSPTMVINTGIQLFQTGELINHITASLIRLLSGFVVGTMAAIILGIFISHSTIIENIVDPIINLVGAVPAFAFLPMLIIWLGVGEFPKLVLIAYATFLPILAYTVDGFKNVNPVLIRSALSLGATQVQVFRRVILKSALPNIFVGMKVSLGLTFSALVVAEMMGADAGLGYIIVDSRNFFKMSHMFLAAALIGIEYTMFVAVLNKIENYLFKWKKGGMGDAIES